MAQVRTHYDNLMVARNAPPEVIRAAYRSLSQKYHPDRNPGNAEAARIMTIVNLAYGVLSDPAKRREHNEWINAEEVKRSENPLGFSTSHIQHGTPNKSTSASSPRDSVTPEERLRPRTRGKSGSTLAHLWIPAIALFLFYQFFWSPTATQNPVPNNFTKNSVPIPATHRPPASTAAVEQYVRPRTSPNGHPWPTTSGYVSGYPSLSAVGLSSLTVDNTQNDSDVFAKLVYYDGGQLITARVFFIKGSENFRLSDLPPGRYDLRYKDLNSGTISKSQTFDLDEIAIIGGTQYSDMSLTLYKVRGGNTHMQTITASEF